MSEILPFDRLVRRVLRADGPDAPQLDVAALARELEHYDESVRERLRLAALRAIDRELILIRQERRGSGE